MKDVSVMTEEEYTRYGRRRIKAARQKSRRQRRRKLKGVVIDPAPPRSRKRTRKPSWG